jgi:periplasmic protein TonB
MTAWVPEPLDATAGRARRRGPWARAAWRWSLLAGLGLHMAMLAAWWVGAQQTEPALPVQPMQVRLTALASAGSAQLAQGRLPAVTRMAAPAAAIASLARERSDLAQPAPPPPSPRDAAQAPMALPKPAPVGPVGPVAPAAAVAAPAQPEAAPSPTPVPNPIAQRPALAPADGPALAALANEAQAAATSGQGEGRRDSPDEIPSSAIAYVVKPVLTFPPGSEDLGEFGSVTLRVWVDEKGLASTVQRLKSSGFARLDQHAVQVIRRARFKPHIDQGKARAGWATVTLNFNPS